VILQKLKRSLKASEKNPDDTETICALACVYRNQSDDTIININNDAMGVKNGGSWNHGLLLAITI